MEKKTPEEIWGEAFQKMDKSDNPEARTFWRGHLDGAKDMHESYKLTIKEIRDKIYRLKELPVDKFNPIDEMIVILNQYIDGK